LIARIPVALVVLPLALLGWVALVVRHEPRLLLAGVPALIVLVLYLRSGSGRSGGARGAA